MSQFPLYGMIAKAWIGVMTVSYTHLDVYKRQISSSSSYNVGMFLDFIGNIR